MKNLKRIQCFVFEIFNDNTNTHIKKLTFNVDPK